MFKNHQLLIFSSIGIIFLSILFFHDLNRTNFQESDFYNKFCSKNYDISCEKINSKFYEKN